MSAATGRKAGLPATVGSDARILVLGSLPGDRSLAKNEYYAHRGNQFWRLIGRVIGADLHALDYAEKLRHLSSAGVGLWDVVASAHRPGSLDSSMTARIPNDLGSFVARLPGLRAIGFNGGDAAKFGRRQLGATPLALFDLPSSSGMNTAPIDAKAAQWLALRPYLEGDRP